MAGDTAEEIQTRLEQTFELQWSTWSMGPKFDVKWDKGGSREVKVG